MTPVITLWNPYDLEINSVPDLLFELKILPVAFSFQVGSTPNAAYNSVVYTNDYSKPKTNVPSLMPFPGGPGIYVSYRINSTGPFKPGETRVFSPDTNVRMVPDQNGGPWGSTHCIPLIAGYRGTGGHVYPIIDGTGAAVGPMPTSTSIRANARFDTEYYGNQWMAGDGVGVYLEMSPVNTGSTYSLAYRTRYSAAIANALHPPIIGSKMLSTTLGAVQSSPLPFLSTMFGPRMTTKTHDATKGLVQCSPFGNFSPTYPRDTNQSPTYAGSGHPINSRFDYSFIAHTGNDSDLPNASDKTGHGYIITGFNSSDGVPRCVLAELPSRPLCSLGELVSWDLRFENPVPPFAYNLVGNSDATPLIPSNAVINAGTASAAGRTNLQIDDSYCANHLLFDDWFFSSITPDPTNFGVSGRTLQATYMDFVTGKTPLANRAYQAILADTSEAAAGTTKALKLYNDRVAKTDSWKSIASRLEVDGMFNVNSTSVTAWRALLGHARKQCVPYIRESGNSWDIALSAATEHPVSRFSIAGDVKAGSAGAGGVFPEATEFTGYRVVDDAFLDLLAKKIVEQIRKRGPFLSLAEFVNRQLSTGDLALAGTLQAALNEVIKNQATNPLVTMQGLSAKSKSNPVSLSNSEDKSGYVFPDAAVGYNSYGLPGWTRQADILRPLAPILSARDDTFTIRGYGDARDANGKVLAHAVCEAVVRRTRDFVDSTEAADITAPPTHVANKTFGRRFEIVSFHWLSVDEV